MKPVAVIPAKGQSRRIPRKNVRMFHGKPIISYTIEAAKESGVFGCIVVSTDDLEIGDLAVQQGVVAVMRPGALTRDDVGPNDVTSHALRELWPALEPEYAACLYATAPMMSPEDISGAYRQLRASGMKYAISVNASPKVPLTDAAQFIWGRTEAFARGMPLFAPHTMLYGVAPERVCDIDVESDWLRAEAMYAALQEVVA